MDFVILTSHAFLSAARFFVFFSNRSVDHGRNFVEWTPRSWESRGVEPLHNRLHVDSNNVERRSHNTVSNNSNI